MAPRFKSEVRIWNIKRHATYFGHIRHPKAVKTQQMQSPAIIGGSDNNVFLYRKVRLRVSESRSVEQWHGCTLVHVRTCRKMNVRGSQGMKGTGGTVLLSTTHCVIVWYPLHLGCVDGATQRTVSHLGCEHSPCRTPTNVPALTEKT